MDTIQIPLPDDWHLHLRDGDALRVTVPAAARCFGRGIVMPNLAPPVTTVEQAAAYRERILACVPEDKRWEPLMVLYLTDNTLPDEMRKARDCQFIAGCKYYPAGATTNSDSGVTDLKKIYRVLEEMQKVGLVLQLHGEVTDPDVDIFDREAVFIERHLEPLSRDFPNLRMVLEHITTQQGAQFVAESAKNIAATITPQHLLFNRNHMLAGGMRPHFYCLPILKRDNHQQALIDAATSGNPKFFLGTDSAPHARSKKEAACGCAGCFSHHAAIEMYAEAFDRAGALDKLQGFASEFGAVFYGVLPHRHSIRLERKPWATPDSLPFAGDELVPLAAGYTLQWQLAS